MCEVEVMTSRLARAKVTNQTMPNHPPVPPGSSEIPNPVAPPDPDRQPYAWPKSNHLSAGSDAEDAAAVGAAFGAVLESSGMSEALALLNCRTRYRFTGFYRVDPPVLRNLYLFDRENPSLALSGEVTQLSNTYCGIVAAACAPFVTQNATDDERLSAHPARDSVVSYVGVPVRSTDGRVFGTLCHFDLRPRILPENELAVLNASSQCVSDWLTTNAPFAA